MASPTEIYLQEFHQRHAGATSAAFGNLRAKSLRQEYASSYHALTSLVPTSAEPQTVLDLACGDGQLLKILHDRNQSSLRLVGVDMSQGELDAARALLPEKVQFLNERAQQLSLNTGSVDWVLSHMAMMLMDDIEHVLTEVRRVLRRGGRLAAIVGRTFLLGEVNEIFLDVFRPIARADLLPLPFGDPRTRSESGWSALLRQHFEDVRFEDIDVSWEPTPEKLWLALTETYDIDRLTASAREHLQGELLSALVHLQRADGTIQTGWGLRLVRAQAA
jgi:SAM-dependent methyltransferase